MPEIHDGTVSAQGGELWYWDTGGDGPPVVLLHSGTGSALNWPEQQGAFAEAGYRVVGYSRRGHYRSSAASGSSAADDLAALATALDLDPFHAVAVAAGGICATDLALGRPAALRSLIIASSIMGIADPDWGARLQALQFPGFSHLPHDFLELGPSYRADNADGLAEWRRVHGLAYSGDEMPIQAISNEITWATLRRLTMPVLLIAGGADLYVPPPVMRELAARIPGAQMVVMSDVGHSAPWERPAEFNHAVLKFIGDVEAART
jgi:pimeloyl-ACP methyl ester carboxylesterase